MGFTDKLKDLRKQAQDAVAEHKDDLQNAVGAVGAAANEKTQGKYADKIAKVGGKVSATVEKLGGHDDEGSATAGSADAAPRSGAPTSEVPTPEPPTGTWDEPAGAPESAQAEAPPPQPQEPDQPAQSSAVPDFE